MIYEMPESLSELSIALKQKEDNVYLCAGATDLMLHLRQQSFLNYGLIDITHIEEMKKIYIENQILHIGAAVTMSEIEKNQLIGRYVPALKKAASMVGSAQIRNRATLGGNVVNASQSADTLPVLLAYAAKAVLLDDNNQKRIATIDDMIIGLGKHNIAPKEALIELQLICDSDFSAFSKVGSRKSVTISKLNACMKASVEENKLTNVCIYLGAIGPKAVEASYIEEVLEGRCLEQMDETAIRKAVYQQIEEKIGNRSSKHYKKSAAFGIILELIEAFKEKTR